MTASFVRIAALVLLALGSAGVAGSTEKLKVGDVPPDDLGRTPSGERIRISEQRGKVVIVSFWASWCGPCRQELPVLDSIQAHVSEDKLRIFSVNWRESRDQFFAIKRALKTLHVTLLSDASGGIGQKYGVSAIPHMIMIGRDGRIAAIHIGYGEGMLPQLVDEINALWEQGEDSAGTPAATTTAL